MGTRRRAHHRTVRRIAVALAFVGVACAVARAGFGIHIARIAHTLVRSAQAQSSPARAAPAPHVFIDAIDVDTFAKGNLHTHSSQSDGDTPPASVFSWYRTHGYQFLALTDHNRRLEPRTYARLERPGFKILAGEEVTMWAGRIPVHVNGICLARKIKGGSFHSKALALRHAIDETAAQGGISLLNHPNYKNSLDADDLWDGREAQLLEIWSGHPFVYSAGVAGRPSHEALWDALLTKGATFYGAAVDDAHDFRKRAVQKRASRPGRGWIQAFSSSHTNIDRGEICDAIRSGLFYSSNGAELERIRVAGRTVEVWPSDTDARVEFIGPKGIVLGTVDGPAASTSYTLKADEAYVRVRVTDSRGMRAWTQAFRTKPG